MGRMKAVIFVIRVFSCRVREASMGPLVRVKGENLES